MTNLNFRSALWLLVALSAMAWVVFAWISGLDLSKVADFFSVVPKVVTVDSIIATVFIKWGWRFKFFRDWLVPFPDLTGTWVGSIRSHWIDPQTNEPLEPIPVMLTIKQSFFHISCVMQTAEMRSDSYSEGFRIDSDRQLRQLAYTYTSRPSLAVSKRSSPHDGTTVFNIMEKPSRKLKGRYWTERKTTGEIELIFKTSDLLEELPEELFHHPLQT